MKAADKQKAIKAALLHPNGVKLSDHQIAEHVGVSHTMVSKYRSELVAASKVCQVTERTGKDGKVYSTENIGKSKAAPVFTEEEAKAEIVLRAERKLGEMLAETIEHGGNPRSHDVTLADLGIAKMQAHRWKSEARVPDDDFRRF